MLAKDGIEDDFKLVGETENIDCYIGKQIQNILSVDSLLFLNVNILFILYSTFVIHAQQYRHLHLKPQSLKPHTIRLS